MSKNCKKIDLCICIFNNIYQFLCIKTINSDDVTGENIKEHNPNWPKIPDHPYRILIIGGLGLEKSSGLLHLIIHLPDIDKICL